MKAILLLALSAIVLSQSYGFVHGAEDMVKVTTDSSSYESGDMITVSGTVMDYVDADGYVYCEITGAMYGLKAAGYIANQDLMKHLAPHGYYSSKQTPEIWVHKTRPNRQFHISC